MRHVGCPFAEATLRDLCAAAAAAPAVEWVAVTHSSPSVTLGWCARVGGCDGLRLVEDESRALYASWGLGRTGVWHFAGLRSLRPADANETAAAWQIAIDSSGPTALVLSRQSVPVLEGTAGAPVARGAYVLDTDEDPEVVLIGTGSEVQWCVAAATTLRAEGHRVRVVSMPSTDLFAAQDDAYQASVLPPATPSLSIEAATTFGWHRWADRCIGIERFGESAPGDEVMEHLGITAEHVVAEAHVLLGTSPP